MKTLVSWSSGKDSAWLVHMLRSSGAEVAGLLTTTNAAAGRVAMHAVRESLVREQAAALQLPVRMLPIPYPCSNAEYGRIMSDAVFEATANGFTHIAFGDLFLEDIRQYREAQLAGTGLTPLFPLFGADTLRLAGDMINAGLKARLTCIDPRVLDREFVGREFDLALMRDLPEHVDRCGERGEFHTFAYGGPMFDRTIAITSGEVVERDGFVFADLLPATLPT